jgi:[ribosomal protein S18]-alanine N-acetyltransferase
VKDIVHLLPGSPVPPWVRNLDEATFGDPWGSLGHLEHLFGLEPYGFARWSALPVAHEAELLRIAVSPEVRRQGLARRLLAASEAFLEQEGIDVFHLEVRTSNHPARALYESMGWTLQRTRKAYYRDGEDAAIYSKASTPRD